MHVAGRVARGRAVFSWNWPIPDWFPSPGARMHWNVHCSHRNVRGEKCALLIGQSSATLAASLSDKMQDSRRDGKVPGTKINIPIATKGGNCGVVRATVSSILELQTVGILPYLAPRAPGL